MAGKEIDLNHMRRRSDGSTHYDRADNNGRDGLMRVRLREKYTDVELGQIYDKKHEHTQWNDHRIRVSSTIALARWISDEVKSVADLSAGDASVINALDVETKYIGDYVPGYEYTGMLEETLELIPDVDLYICTETIEHIDDPDALLRQIRRKSKMLILSTPIGETGTKNSEHYWGWSDQDIEEMLSDAGWKPRMKQNLYFQGIYDYDFQTWLCD